MTFTNRHAAIRKATSLSNLVTVPVSHCYGAQAISLTFPNGFKFSYSGDCRPSKAFAITGKDSTVLLHEATFDDELVGDAVAKKHSTTSEAIGVGVAMGAKRVLLTHFSQRYQKIPGSNSMSNLRVQLEDAEETEDPMEGIEPPVNAEDEGATDLLAPKTDLTGVYRDKTQDTTTTPAFVSLKSMTNLSRPPTNDMKVGVAFDHMRVKVGDIEHLECFTPALRELYKEEEKKDARGKRAAKEAFSDNLQDIKPSKASASGAREDSQKAPEAKKGSQKPLKNEKKGQKKSDSFFRKQPQNGMEDAHVESTTARLDAEENLISPPETRRLNEDTQVQEEGPRIRRDNPEEILEKTPSPKRPTTSLEGGEDATLPPPPHDSTTASKEQTHTASPFPPQDPPGNVPTPPETGEDAGSAPIRRYRSGGIQGEHDAGSAPIRRYGSQGI